MFPPALINQIEDIAVAPLLHLSHLLRPLPGLSLLFNPLLGLL
jgi:hypothetical protein